MTSPDISRGTSGADGSHLLQPGVLDTSHGVVLYLDDVTVSFDGFRALNKLGFSVDAGRVALHHRPQRGGQNHHDGCYYRQDPADSGTVFFGQTMDLTRMTEPEIAQAGIGRKFQKPTVFEQHTVFENLELALKTDKRIWHSLFGKLKPEERASIHEILATIALPDKADTRAGLLSHGQKQWLEIGMLLAQQPQLLLLDEPVAGMTDQETERTAELLNTLAGKHSIVVVEHDMDFVASIARKVTVLHEGSVLAEGSMDTVQNDEKVIEVYLGR